MDKATAQALHELSANGRFSDESLDTIHKALGWETDEETGLTGPPTKGDDDDDKASSKSTAAKGSGR